MAYGKGYRRYAKRRVSRGKKPSYSTWRSRKNTSNYRRKYRYNPNTMITRVKVPGMVALPDEYICKFRFSQDNALSPAVGNSYLASWRYRMNSLYDPDLDGGGNQPYLFDQLVGPINTNSKPYQYYLVYGCKIRITFYVDSANTIPAAAYLYPSGSNAQGTPAVVNDLDELPYIKRADLSLPGGSATQRTLSMYMPIHKIEKLDKRLWTADSITDYSADGNNNPTKCPVYEILVRPVNAATGCKVFYNATLTYYTKLFGRSGYINGS